VKSALAACSAGGGHVFEEGHHLFKTNFLVVVLVVPLEEILNELVTDFGLEHLEHELLKLINVEEAIVVKIVVLPDLLNFFCVQAFVCHISRILFVNYIIRS